jgi:hypothetical protein
MHPASVDRPGGLSHNSDMTPLPASTLAIFLLAMSLPVAGSAASTVASPADHLLGSTVKTPSPQPPTGGDNGVVDDWDEQEDTLLDRAIKLLEVAEVAPTVKDLNEAIKDLSVAEDMEEQEIHPREVKEPKGPRGPAGPRKPTSSRPRKVKEDHDEIIKQEKNAIQLVQEAVVALKSNNRAKVTENVEAALLAIKKADQLNEDEDPNEATEAVKAGRTAAGATAPAKPRKK